MKKLFNMPIPLTVIGPLDQSSNSQLFVNRPGPNGAWGQIVAERHSISGHHTEEIFLSPENWEWLKKFFRDEKD